MTRIDKNNNNWRNGFLRVQVLMTILALLIPATGSAQTYRKGQHVEPAYEGWRPNPDGTFSFMFGYMNENWEEEPHVPVGENNFFSR